MSSLATRIVIISVKSSSLVLFIQYLVWFCSRVAGNMALMACTDKTQQILHRAFHSECTFSTLVHLPSVPLLFSVSSLAQSHSLKPVMMPHFRKNTLPFFIITAGCYVHRASWLTFVNAQTHTAIRDFMKTEKRKTVDEFT